MSETHWSFMDRYADVLIARGPTMTDDRTAATGSGQHGTGRDRFLMLGTVLRRPAPA